MSFSILCSKTEITKSGAETYTIFDRHRTCEIGTDWYAGCEQLICYVSIFSCSKAISNITDLTYFTQMRKAFLIKPEIDSTALLFVILLPCPAMLHRFIYLLQPSNLTSICVASMLSFFLFFVFRLYNIHKCKRAIPMVRKLFSLLKIVTSANFALLSYSYLNNIFS